MFHLISSDMNVHGIKVVYLYLFNLWGVIDIIQEHLVPQHPQLLCGRDLDGIWADLDCDLGVFVGQLQGIVWDLQVFL